MLLGNLVFSPLLTLLDPVYLWKCAKQEYSWKRLREGELKHYTQKEVNEMFEPPEACIDVRYCNVIRTLLVSVFFFDMCPIGMPICLAYFFVQFWVDKYLYLRRFKRIKRFHSSLAVELNENAEFSIFLLIIGSITFKIKANKTIHIMDFCLLAAACLLLLVPLKKIAETRDHQAKVIEEYHEDCEEEKNRSP